MKTLKPEKYVSHLKIHWAEGLLFSVWLEIYINLTSGLLCKLKTESDRRGTETHLLNRMLISFILIVAPETGCLPAALSRSNLRSYVEDSIDERSTCLLRDALASASISVWPNPQLIVKNSRWISSLLKISNHCLGFCDKMNSVLLTFTPT
jgi:hypothetical protein